MTIGTTTALSLITGGLRRTGSYAAGESLDSDDANDCLETLNDLLDSLSLDKDIIFGSTENILAWTANQNQYTVGNPINSVVGSASFTGTLTSGSPTITAVSRVPSDMVTGSAAAYLVGSGSIVTDSQGLVPASTTVTATNSGASTITLSDNATGSSSGVCTFAYTIPGDFPIVRPLHITHGFTRFNSLDFTLDVYETQSQYTEILYKAQPGPWPTVAWYNAQFPYGILNVYQTPGNNAALHLFTATLLSNLTLNQVVVMPQGYARALKWLLAKEFCAEFGWPLTQEIKVNADESLNLIKALNAKPAAVSRYDRILTRGNRPDGGWIMHGGYK
jgi:hypothetical protein